MTHSEPFGAVRPFPRTVEPVGRYQNVSKRCLAAGQELSRQFQTDSVWEQMALATRAAAPAALNEATADGPP
ncbi:hypothetical protein KXW77_000670, partial [Aspergillus fumigatus]